MKVPPVAAIVTTCTGSSGSGCRAVMCSLLKSCPCASQHASSSSRRTLALMVRHPSSPARLAAAIGVLVAMLLAAPAAGQPPPAPAPELKLSGPSLRAAGIDIPLTGRGAPAGARVELQRFVHGERWVTIKTKKAAGGSVKLTYDPGKLSPRYRLRIAVGGLASPAITVRTREVTLAAFGDANFGDGVASVMDARGALWPWSGVAPTLRAADIAFGNLECSISNRGSPVSEGVQFRGRPGRSAQGRAATPASTSSTSPTTTRATSATTHSLDTLRAVRSAGALPVGAGANLAAARGRWSSAGWACASPSWASRTSAATSFAAGPVPARHVVRVTPRAITAGVRAAARVQRRRHRELPLGRRALDERDRPAALVRCDRARGRRDRRHRGPPPRAAADPPHRQGPPPADRLQPRQLRLVGGLGARPARPGSCA